MSFENFTSSLKIHTPKWVTYLVLLIFKCLESINLISVFWILFFFFILRLMPLFGFSVVSDCFPLIGCFWCFLYPYRIHKAPPVLCLVFLTRSPLLYIAVKKNLVRWIRNSCILLFVHYLCIFKRWFFVFYYSCTEPLFTILIYCSECWKSL